MSHLNDIKEKVAKSGAHTEDWRILKNAYFRSENAANDVRAWAEKNGLWVSFEYGERSFEESVILTVTFFPKVQAK